jgi:hypothetical protein
MERTYRVAYLVTNEMNDLTANLHPLAAVTFAAFLPLAIAIVNRRRWRTEIKAVSALVLSVVFARIYAYFDGIETFSGTILAIAAIYALSQAAYHGIWKPTGAADKVENLTG